MKLQNLSPVRLDGRAIRKAGTSVLTMALTAPLSALLALLIMRYPLAGLALAILIILGLIADYRRYCRRARQWRELMEKYKVGKS